MSDPVPADRPPHASAPAGAAPFGATPPAGGGTDAPLVLPPPARYLGVGGLLPFAFLCLAANLDAQHRAFWIHAQIAYGAVILSFVGALHWAFAMLLTPLAPARRWLMMGWSVVPALVAWVALLLPAGAALVLLIGLFALHFRIDMLLALRHGLPRWYLQLRLTLTAGAVFSLLLTLFA